VATKKDNDNDPTSRAVEDDDDVDDDDDLDTLLEEYKLRDTATSKATTTTTTNGETQAHAHAAPLYYDTITSKMEVRDLDIEHVRRSLFGGITEGGGGASSSSRRTNRGRQHNVFGTHANNWPRPPHYVGGGIGTKTYRDDETANAKAGAPASSSPTQTRTRAPPWPYCDMNEGDPRRPPPDHWFEFRYSDSYQRDCRDLETIRASGDPNALALFVAHHPFVVEALLQLSIVLCQTNRHREGLVLLKRALWVYECACAAAPSVLPDPRQRGGAFLDAHRPTNRPFVAALLRLLRVARVGGLPRTSLATAQFLLSLDPLRDPANVLLGLDHLALACHNDGGDNDACGSGGTCGWLVELAESGTVPVAYRDEETRDDHECQLLDLPNWSFSYALALFHLHRNEHEYEHEHEHGSSTRTPSTEDCRYSKERADTALKTAFSRFPSVIGRLLAKNDVDVQSRSMQTDWPTVVGFIDTLVDRYQTKSKSNSNPDPVVRAHTSQACDHIIRIFVQQNFKLWSSFAVTKWMYENLVALQQETTHGGTHGGTNGEQYHHQHPSPAMMRYARADPNDYETKFQTMPADADPFDPNVVALALDIDPNRRRLVQRNHHARHAGGAGFPDPNGIDFA